MESQSTPDQTPAQPQPNQAPQPPVVGQKTNAMAIVALVCAFILPILGFILALVALSQIKKSQEGGKGVAVAALVISIVIFVIVGALLLLISFGTMAAVQNTDSTSTSTTSSASQNANYSEDEKKAVSTSEAFLNDLKSGNYSAAYNLMGPELKKEYKDANDFATQAKEKNLNLIKSWSVTSVTTVGDSIEVKGDLKASGANSSGTFAFSYYKDADGSINMLSYELSPS